MISGTNQSLSVSTTGCPGALCQLKNDKGTWYVASTPRSVTVHRAYGDLTVMCKKEGFPDATAKVSSSTKVATALLWKVLQIAEFTFRRLKGAELLPAVYAGAPYVDGVQRSTSRQQQIAA